MFKNTKKQGDWGLGVAISYFVTGGYTVSIPLTDSQDYDLVVEINGKLQRVQVKTTTFKGSSEYYKVSLSVKGGNRSYNTIKKFDPQSVDYVFVVTKDGDKYFIPATNLNSGMTLNKSYEVFKV